MNCIDAVEGMAKALLGKFQDVSTEYRLDDSEYIRNVKAVIDTVILFVKNNPEVSETPELIREVLYDYAKTRWLARLEKTVDFDQEAGAARDLEYQAYCYDYLYAHGNYPR
ncbi:hypothetical protein [uncultured Desulfosarcina sp.]|uniref:hypothetical protein n=1 Tax=uncultured Desulfosarcina sp. TaxID=218289 RepID=UPI0029C973C7|nr:hypothetical protein [uncultured Desulfosarcina sp.]